MGNAYTKKDLQIMQKWSLQRKIQVTQTRIMEWFMHWDGKVFVSFSGGKDSTVLADLAARVCRGFDYTLTLVFVDTGLEYPEIKKFVPLYAQRLRDVYKIPVDLVVLRPNMTFDKVVTAFGYPVISKNVANVIRGARAGQKSRLEKIKGTSMNGG